VPLVLRNEQALMHHWLRLKVVGSGMNREAIGARVEVRTGNVTQTRVVMPSRGYLAQVELPVTFGLGTADRVDSVRVIWPDGVRREWTDVVLDQETILVRPEP
jgi:enediyne biosynthesis protein E4